MRRLVKQLRGALGTALTWGVTWALGTVLVGGVLFALGAYPNFSLKWLVLVPAVRSGVAGVLAGVTFSAFLSVAYRRRTIAGINAPLFALGGAAVGALLMTVLAVGPYLVTGLPLHTAAWAIPLVLGSSLGGLTAGASIWAAKSAEHIAMPEVSTTSLPAS